MITQYSFADLPDGHSLRRLYTVTADARWDREHDRWAWMVRCDGGYVHPDGQPYGAVRLYELDEALAVAERASREIKLWTSRGDMTASEALAAGLR